MALKKEKKEQSNKTFNRFKWHQSYVFKFSLAFGIIFLLLNLSLISSQHYFKRREVAQRFGQTLQTIVKNYAPLINGDLLESIQSNLDKDKLEFQSVKAILKKAQQLNQLDQDLIYILKPTSSKEWRFQVMLQEETFIGDRYTPPSKLAEVYAKALQGTAAYSKVFHDQHGAFISAVAPIRNQLGQVVALLEADFRLEVYLKQLEQSYIEDIGLAIISLLLISLISIWMYRRLNLVIFTLLKGTQAIEDEDYSYQIKLKGKDELSILAGALNQVLNRLKERHEMLRFLPTHTQAMIKRVLLDGEQTIQLSEARDLEVVVFESDIRGFTALSENLSPAETIALINRYIELQAEYLLKYGGSIDKYMGDAVLVVFEGDNREYRAVNCAQEILSTIQELNEELSQSIQIGIGISSGHVVMGNMGCDARMEHTVIGPTVNLAARLCSKAQEGELVVQKRVFEKAKQVNQQIEPLLAYEQELHVKGFSRSVSVRRSQQTH